MRPLRTVFVFVCFLFTRTSLSSSESLSPKTLKRTADAVHVQGKDLLRVQGGKISNLSLFAFHDGTWEPVPFQIDKKDEKGQLVFAQQGPTPDGEGLLERSDELTFMAADTGDRAAFKDWDAGQESGVEIEVADMETQEKGWVYLFLFSRPAPRSEKDYVQYDPVEDEIVAEKYVFVFSKDVPVTPDVLAIRGSDGNWDDELDRLKIRFSAKTFIGMSVHGSENDFSSKRTGYKDGQVRVLRRTDNKVKLFGLFSVAFSPATYIYYGNFYQFPLALSMPENMKQMIVRAGLRISLDWEKTSGRMFYSMNNPAGFLIDGVESEEEKKADLGISQWLVYAGEKGGWFFRLVTEKELESRMKLYYKDDAKTNDSPEDSPGQIGNAGFVLEHVEDLKPGEHKLLTTMYCLSNYSAGMEKEYLDILDQPLKVTTGGMGLQF